MSIGYLNESCQAAFHAGLDRIGKACAVYRRRFFQSISEDSKKCELKRSSAQPREHEGRMGHGVMIRGDLSSEEYGS